MAATRKTTQVKTTGSRAALVKKAAAKAEPAATTTKKAAPAAAAKTNVVKLTAPVAAPVASKPAANEATPVVKVVASKDQATQIAAKPVANTQSPAKLEFEAGDYVVYPVHGVGKVERVETIAIAGFSVTTYVITFDKERMTLKVPVSKAKASGLRKLSTKDRVKSALETLTGKAQIRRVMWSRRAQEYEAKINSGDLVQIAEVVRDLHRATDQPEQSYSERQIYQAAIERLAREVAAIEKIDEVKATAKLESVLAKAA